jgi:hypothetical protein
VTITYAIARLKQIRDNKKSTYHKAFMNGNLAVMKSKNKTYRGKGFQYDIVEIIPISLGTDICGGCQKNYLSLDEDYLCPECRSEI